PSEAKRGGSAARRATAGIGFERARGQALRGLDYGALPGSGSAGGGDTCLHVTTPREARGSGRSLRTSPRSSPSSKRKSRFGGASSPTRRAPFASSRSG